MNALLLNRSMGLDWGKQSRLPLEGPCGLGVLGAGMADRWTA